MPWWEIKIRHSTSIAHFNRMRLPIMQVHCISFNDLISFSCLLWKGRVSTSDGLWKPELYYSCTFIYFYIGYNPIRPLKSVPLTIWSLLLTKNRVVPNLFSTALYCMCIKSLLFYNKPVTPTYSQRISSSNSKRMNPKNVFVLTWPQIARRKKHLTISRFGFKQKM